MFSCEYCETFETHLFRRTSERCSVIKRNCWNLLLSIFMFSCANLNYKYAQSNSYWVLNFKSVKITDMKSTPIWISYHFWTYKHLDKLDRKRYGFFQFHIGQFSYRASFKGRLVLIYPKIQNNHQMQNSSLSSLAKLQLELSFCKKMYLIKAIPLE